MLTKKLPERDGEIMHSMDETTTDAAFERETTDPSAALPAIEKQLATARANIAKLHDKAA